MTIVGPIASGKSTTARALAVRLRAHGVTVAVLDLDDVVEEIGGFATLTPERFGDALDLLGERIGAWLSRGVDVIAHGPFFQAYEEAAILGAVPQGTPVHRLRLMTDYDVALSRVDGDPERDLSRDPALLRLTYDRVEELLPKMPAPDWSFDTAETSVNEIIDTVLPALVPGSRS